MKILAPLAVLAPLLAAPALASTITVGPTGAFTEISAAIAAAQPGDTLLVDAGTYQAFSVDKPLRIIGRGQVVVAGFATSAISVLALPAGSEVFISGMDVDAFAVTAINLASGLGSVVLQDVNVGQQTHAVALQANACARVMLLDSTFEDSSGPALGVQRGTIEATQCELIIANCTIIGDNTPSGFAIRGDHGLVLDGGGVKIWRSVIRGGDGLAGKGIFVSPHGGDGLRATDARVSIFGGPDSSVSGGTGAPAGPFGGGPGLGGVGLNLMGTTVAHWQVGVPIVGGADASGGGQGSAILTTGGASAVGFSAVFASLRATTLQTTAGGAVSLEFDGNPAATCATFAAFKTVQAYAFGGIAGIGVLDLAAYTQLPAVVLDGGGQATLDFQVPAIPALVGESIWIQSVEVNGPQLTITNPVVSVVIG